MDIEATLYTGHLSTRYRYDGYVLTVDTSSFSGNTTCFRKSQRDYDKQVNSIKQLHIRDKKTFDM